MKENVADRREFAFRRGTVEDIDLVMALMEQVKAGMSCPDWYVTDDRTYMEQHIADRGFLLLAETKEGETAGFFVVDIPVAACENLGTDMGLSPEDCRLVVHMDSAAVLPLYRGNHLQKRLVEAAERELAGMGYLHYFCTVHPENHASLRTMQQCGYTIVKTTRKYGGLLRHILYKYVPSGAPHETATCAQNTVLVSACLLGMHCRYNEKGVLDEAVRSLMTQATLIPVCPELAGGLPTPREPAERVGETVVTHTGQDVTAQYQKGAWETFQIARLYGCSCAVLKERSPSCGNGQVYDGTHSGRLIPGMGMTAQLLQHAGIRVFGETGVEECRDYLKQQKKTAFGEN